MKVELGFGKTKVPMEIAADRILGTLTPNPVPTAICGEAEVKRALAAPIGTPRLRDIVKPGEKIAIVTSDITRPMPSKQVMPLLLEELSQAGIALTDVTVVFALGSHRKHTAAEQKGLVGDEVYSQVRCVDSDGSDCIHLGVTSHGTPVDIFRTVAEADRRICLGNIEYHYFAGYSGGVKAILPGTSTREAIQANHSKMVLEAARAGEMANNPVRRDIDEVLSFVPVDFILNVVLDEHKTIIKAVAGHPVKAHRVGCQFLDRFYKVRIKEPADIVVVSAGGHPKDINLYQAQKALDNAKYAVKEGGIIILVASCKEGFGEVVFENWMREAEAPNDLIAKIQQQFVLGGHKAAAIALVLNKCRIYVVSDLEADEVRQIFMKPYSRVQEALDDALAEFGTNSKVMIMPYGGSTLPEVIV